MTLASGIDVKDSEISRDADVVLGDDWVARLQHPRSTCFLDAASSDHIPWWNFGERTLPTENVFKSRK